MKDPEKPAVCIIPARGGSKGIPGKNITNLGGFPLIAWSILCARTSRHVRRVIVSTDSEEIAEVSRQYGAEVPFLRPAHLATDTANVADSIHLMLDYLHERGEDPVFSLVLFPTHPFRSPELIDHLIESAISSNAQKTQTARLFWWNPDFWFHIQNGEARKITGTPAGWAAHGYNLACLMKNERCDDGKPFSPDSVCLFPVNWPSGHADIDTPSDLSTAEDLVRRREVPWIPSGEVFMPLDPGQPLPRPAAASLSIYFPETGEKICDRYILEELPPPFQLRRMIDSVLGTSGKKLSGVAAGSLPLEPGAMKEKPILRVKTGHPLQTGIGRLSDLPVDQDAVIRAMQPITFDPVVITSLTRFDPSRGWIDARNGRHIQGRQQLPDIFEWDGSFFLPSSCNEGTHWGIAAT